MSKFYGATTIYTLVGGLSHSFSFAPLKAMQLVKFGFC